MCLHEATCQNKHERNKHAKNIQQAPWYALAMLWSSHSSPQYFLLKQVIWNCIFLLLGDPSNIFQMRDALLQRSHSLLGMTITEMTKTKF